MLTSNKRLFLSLLVYITIFIFLAFHDFLSKVLQKDVDMRPRCLALGQHEFLNNFDENKAKGQLLEVGYFFVIFSLIL